MRADMGKVLVERPRPGSRDGSRPRKGYRKRQQKGLDDGDAPAREAMNARCGGTRFFNEHLAPLRRFLNSNVGRPWDKIYSEICARVDRGNVVQKHILTHLFDYVVVTTILIDGEPCVGERTSFRFHYGAPLRECDRRDQWYVCPKSGLLRRCRYVPYRRPRRPLARHVTLDAARVCIELNGQWELLTVAPLPTPEYGGERFDVVMKRTVHASSAGPARQLYGARVYATDRRPLSRAELRSLPIPIDWLEKPVRGQVPRHN